MAERPAIAGGLIPVDRLRDPATVRPPGGAVFDLHVHSSDRSMDSGVRAGAIAAQAALRGLDGVCLTEHNSLWPEASLHELSERHQVTVLRGMELGTDVGHVLAFGLDRYRPQLLLIDELCRIVESEGAVLALAHPMRPSHGRSPGWDEMAGWFDALEAINGDHADGEHGPYMRLAERLGMAAIAGSDVHSRQAVGRAVTAFEQPVPDVEALVRLLRERRVAPRDLRPPPASASQPSGASATAPDPRSATER